MIEITSDTKLIRVPYEQRFLSGMAFSVYEVVRVACLAVYSKYHDPPKVAIKFHRCYQIPKSSHPPENNDPPKDATSKSHFPFLQEIGKMIEITSDPKLTRGLFLTIIMIFDIPLQTIGHTF